MVEAASDANKAYEEENERLRLELEAAQQQLAAVQQKQSSLPVVPASHKLPLPACVVCVKCRCNVQQHTQSQGRQNSGETLQKKVSDRNGSVAKAVMSRMSGLFYCKHCQKDVLSQTKQQEHEVSMIPVGGAMHSCWSGSRGEL